MSWCDTPPTDPVLKYAPDAQGHDVPAFAVVMLPQTTTGPMRAIIQPSMPGERGLVFHACMCERARLEARMLGLGAEWVGVWFTNTLPSVAYRQDWAERARLRWSIMMPSTPPMLKVWACGKLARMVAPYLEGAPK